MGSLLVSAICAIALGAGQVQAPADTLKEYIIDGFYVRDFDGSQLVGKTIQSYRIVSDYGIQSGKYLNIHIISTSRNNVKYVVDNIGYTSEEFEKLWNSKDLKPVSVSLFHRGDNDDDIIIFMSTKKKKR